MKRILLKIFVPLSLFLISCTTNADYFGQFKFIEETVKKIEKKYGLYAIGRGGGADNDKMRVIHVSFTLKDSPMTKEQARKQVIMVVEDFLKDINSDEKLIPFFINFPVTAKNVRIFLFCSEKKGKRIYQPYVGFVACDQGKLIYMFDDPEFPETYKCKSYETESFEEGVRLLRESENNAKI